MKNEASKPLIAFIFVIFLIGLGTGLWIEGNKSKSLEIQNQELHAAIAEGIETINKLEAELDVLNRAIEEFIKEDERSKPENQEEYREVGR